MCTVVQKHGRETAGTSERRLGSSHRLVSVAPGLQAFTAGAQVLNVWPSSVGFSSPVRKSFMYVFIFLHLNYIL